MTLALKTPEDFGAVGDGTTDDSVALAAWLNSWAVPSNEQSVGLALTPGKVYAHATPLVATGGATGTNARLQIQGNGAMLKFTGGAGLGYAWRLGSLAGGKKLFYSSIRDLHFRLNSQADGGLLIDYSDFTVFDNVQSTGQTISGGANIKGVQGNSNVFRNVLTTGGDIGALIGNQGGVMNVFSWYGGKAQQHRIGLKYSGAVFAFEDLDLSIISEWAVHLANASSGRLKVYTEQIGSGTKGNLFGCVRLESVKATEVAGLLNATNGAVNAGTHAGYAVKCEGSIDIRVCARGQLPQRAFVETDAACRNVVVERGADCQTTDFETAQPCPYSDGTKFRNLAAVFLKSIGDPLAPVSLLPASLASWTASQGAAVLAETPLNYLGDGYAQAITFPQVNPASVYTKRLTGLTAGDTYRAEVRCRLLRFLVPIIANRTVDLACLRLRMTEGGAFSEIYPRIGDGWQDFYVDFVVPGGYTGFWTYFQVKALYEPIDIAVDFIRVYKLV